MTRIASAIVTEQAASCATVAPTLNGLSTAWRTLAERPASARARSRGPALTREARALSDALDDAAASAAGLVVARAPRRPEDLTPQLRWRLAHASCPVWLAGAGDRAAPPSRVLCCAPVAEAAQGAAAVAAVFAAPGRMAPELRLSLPPEEADLRRRMAHLSVILEDLEAAEREAARHARAAAAAAGLPEAAAASATEAAAGVALSAAAATMRPDLLVTTAGTEEMSAAIALLQRRATRPGEGRPAAPPAGVVLVSDRAAARFVAGGPGGGLTMTSPALARAATTLLAGASIAGGMWAAVAFAARPRPV